MSSDPIEVLLDKAAALEKVLPVAREYAHAPEVREFREALAAALASLSAPPAQGFDAEVVAALHCAEAALADIGDADREPGDDIAWAERRAAEALPKVRHALAAAAKGVGRG